MKLALQSALFVSILAIAQTISADTLVGSLPGSSAVDNSGKLNHGIPIPVPAGSGDLEPTLGISHESRGGNGILGVGFSLDGLSSITRAPATVAHDGSIDPVDFDGLDRFSLDGQRLMLVSPSGVAYGADGSEYRTEVANFSKVVAQGQVGNGPASFKVWTKTGRIMEYGVSDDSRIEATGRSDVLVWALKRISDTNGNYIVFDYQENQTLGSFYLQRIAYTGNDKTGLRPYSSIEFTYEDRPDPILSKVSGSTVDIRSRLQRIVMKSSGEFIREFRFTYQISASSGRSLLQKVQSYAGVTNGVEGSHTLPPTTFEWANSANRWKPQSQWLGTASPGGSTTTWPGDYTMHGDFNGDGKTDHMYRDTSSIHWYVATSTGTSFSTPTKWLDRASPGGGDTSIGAAYHFIADFNGDGLDDFMYRGNPAPYDWYVCLSTGTSFQTPVKWLNGTHLNMQNQPTYTGSVGYRKVADFDGDGRADYAMRGGSIVSWYVFLSTGSSFSSPTAWISTNDSDAQPTFNDTYYAWGDFNGDGRVDYAYYGGAGVKLGVRVLLSNGTGFDQPTTWQRLNDPEGNRGFDQWLVGDINGDSLSDLFYYGYSTGARHLMISNGAGFDAPVRAFDRNDPFGNDTASSPVAYSHLIDVNGDGRHDYVYRGYSVNHWFVNYSRGKTFAPAVMLLESGTGAATIDQAYADADHLSFGDFDGDARTDYVFARPSLRSPMVALASHVAYADQITSITNGFGEQTTITYAPITDTPAYTKGTGAVYPFQDIQRPIYVVTRLGKDNGTATPYYTHYVYGVARVHLQGRGFLGFHIFNSYDPQKNRRIIEYNSWTHPFTGMTTRVEHSVGTQMISQVDNTLAYISMNGGVSQFPFVQSSTETSWEYGYPTTPISVKTSSNVFDDYGNNVDVKLEWRATSGAAVTHSQQTKSVFFNDPTKWILGRNVTTQQINIVPGDTQSRTANFEYDSVTGLLSKEVIEPNNATLKLETEHERDGYGNVIRSSISGPGFDRIDVVRRSFDPQGRFPIVVTNALGHKQEAVFDNQGNMLQSRSYSSNGKIHVTSWDYDAFGRQLVQRNEDQTKVITAYEWLQGGTPAAALYKTTVKTDGAADVISYFDRLGRELRAETKGGSAQTIFRDTEYDDKGRVARTSEPFAAPEAPQWTTPTYDALDRVYEQLSPDGTVTRFLYKGLELQTIRNANGADPRTQINYKDVLGNDIRIRDNASKDLWIKTDAFGNKIETKDHANNITRMAYDIRGNRIRMEDPDMGTWQYVWDARGLLKEQTDAKSQRIAMSYDLLGRKLSEVSSFGTCTWEYDGNEWHDEVGRLRRSTVTKANGSTHRRAHYYDQFGRLFQDLSFTAERWYYTEYLYDQYSRVSDAVFFWKPRGYEGREYDKTPLWQSFGLHYERNAQGYLTQITDTSGYAWWHSPSYDSMGRVTSHTTGNGHVTTQKFNPQRHFLEEVKTAPAGASTTTIQHLQMRYSWNGNLEQRKDLTSGGITENFSYDNRDALTLSEVQGGPSVSVNYNDIGNITNKGDVGSYSYNPARPHAVASAGGYSMTYDANGNMVSRLKPGAGKQLIDWNAFNMPGQFSIEGGMWTNQFDYDADHNRITQYINYPTPELGGYQRRIYVGGDFEQEDKQVTVSGNPTWQTQKTRIYISAPSGRVGTLTFDLTGAQPVQVREHYCKDHLGSVVAVTAENGSVVERYAFDPWGKRRDTANANNPVTASTFKTPRGFTGHEMMDNFVAFGGDGLVHMNGRIYDSSLGRFLSADPFIQATGVMLAYNRYSYVLNNPTSFTDPSGYFFKKLFKKVGEFFKDNWKTIVSATLSYFAPPIGAAFMVATSAVDGYRAGGLKGALLGVGQAVATIAIGAELGPPGGFGLELQRAAAHGVSAGVFSELQGGNFGSGFMAGAVASAAGSISGGHTNNRFANVAIAAVAGGTASVITGGKFANGAATGTMVSLLNHGLHDNQDSSEQTVADFVEAGEGVATVVSVVALALDIATIPSGEGLLISAVARRSIPAFFKRVGETFVSSTARRKATGEIGDAITDASRRRVKQLVRNLSKPEKNSGLSQEKVDQLRRITSKAGGRIRVDADGVKGTGIKPHAHVEGLGSKVESRHIWLEEGVK